MTKSNLNYEDAGVNIDHANQLVNDIKSITKSTHRPGVISNIGGFGALFEIPEGYQQPLLVSGTDGVGTKLKLAMELNKHDTIGIDLVAMCVNDILCLGAEPLYFLDYFATGKLNLSQAKDIISGIGEGCRQAGCALVGGETAEMPGMYHGGDYDLAGFCTGVVEKSKAIDGSNVKVGDKLIALASSGPHSNGYSLVRKVLEVSKKPLTEQLDGKNIGEILLTPTRIYCKTVLSILQNHKVHAMVHITGGGLLENIPRVLPEGTKAIINQNSWTVPSIFQWLQDQGNILDTDMFRTFNMGVGFILCVPAEDANTIREALTHAGENAWEIGQIESCNDQDERVVL